MSCPTCAKIKALLGDVSDIPARLDSLTLAEREILVWVGKHHTNEEIARGLGRSVHTVASHLRAINIKLGVKSRRKAVLYAEALKENEIDAAFGPSPEVVPEVVPDERPGRRGRGYEAH